MKGYHGKILRVNLSDGSVKEEPLREELAKLYLGGRGLGVRILYDELRPKIDPLSPENKLVIATGPMQASNAPTAGRYAIVTKSPLTGTIFDSHSGGTFGVALKMTGYDAIIVEGASEKPVYLWVDEEHVEIGDAGDLWGKTTHEATDELVKRTKPGAKVACIGPAGERLVRFAAVINDKNRAAGRGGVGAVFGSKKLKAVVVSGSKKAKVADEEELRKVVQECVEVIKKNPVTKDALPRYGTSVLVNVINELGMFPTRNFQDGYFEDADAFSGETIKTTILVGNKACAFCPIACGRVTKLNGRSGEGPEYETVWAFGADCGVRDLEAIAEANYLCNELGLDTISTGATIACAMEMSEKGYIKEQIRFGDARAIVELTRKIAFREGIGDELAEGSYRFASKYGHPECSMSVKKMEMPAYDPRGAFGMGLAYATSNRGACHLRAYTISVEVLGAPYRVNRFTVEGKAKIVALLQNVSATVDSMVLCRFSQFALSPELYARLLTAVTGEKFTGSDVVSIGERIYNLERLFNVREGFSREDDTLPERLLKEPLKDGHSKGHVVDLELMLEEYYRVRGWDENGVPKKETLERLGISA